MAYPPTSEFSLTLEVTTVLQTKTTAYFYVSFPRKKIVVKKKFMIVNSPF